MISVTQVLARSGIIDTTWYTEEGRDRGKAVHEATEFVDEGDLDEQWLQRTDETTRGRIKAYQSFISQCDVTVIRSEFEVVHPTLQYVGHPDRLLTINGKLAVVDIKPPNMEKWHGVQLAAYQRAIVDSAVVIEGGIPLRYNLYLNQNGKYKLEPRTNPRDWLVFQAALTLVRYKEAR